MSSATKKPTIRCMLDVSLEDVSQGHEWAKDHVTKATRGMLGWTLSRKRSGRGFVTLRIGD